MFDISSKYDDCPAPYDYVGIVLFVLILPVVLPLVLLRKLWTA
jgi:hypothetical protein